MTRIARSIGVLLVTGVVVACGGSVTKGDGAPDATAPSRVCVPGESVACVGADGCFTSQVCNATGTALGPCACTSSPDGGAHADASGDASRDADAARDARQDSSGSPDAKKDTGVTFDGGACPYVPTDTTDHDGDGWSNADGDCDDCNRFINPGAYDIPGDHVDQDCSGVADDEPTGCDSTLTGPATTTGSEGAMALDLCRTAVASAPLHTKTWGVLSADYVLPDGTTNPVADPNDGMTAEYTCSYSADSFLLGFGLLGPSFGTSNATQQGTHMLGLSTGTARQPTDTGYVASNDTGGSATAGQGYPGFDKCYTNGAPTGFPGQTPACGAVMFGTPHDGAALRVAIRVPTNALTMSFDTNFFSYEFPSFVCSTYNDTFVVIMTPPPAGEPASANGDVALDSMGNVISVNAGFLTVCNQNQMAGSRTYPCVEGPAKLVGTGFGVDTTATAPNGDMQNHASTDWLTTTVSVGALEGQDVTLLFAVWDSSDGVYDTTVLVDNVRWTFATAPNTVVSDGGPPVTVPK